VALSATFEIGGKRKLFGYVTSGCDKTETSTPRSILIKQIYAAEALEDARWWRFFG
jgi:hypothetical protein